MERRRHLFFPCQYFKVFLLFASNGIFCFQIVGKTRSKSAFISPLGVSTNQDMKDIFSGTVSIIFSCTKIHLRLFPIFFSFLFHLNKFVGNLDRVTKLIEITYQSICIFYFLSSISVAILMIPS